MASGEANIKTIWQSIWSRLGRTPLRLKIIGIVVTSLLVLGLSIAWWVRTELGGWLSYLLSEERVAQAMSVGTRGVVIITILATVVGLVIAWVMTWALTRPILHITRVAKRVERGDLSPRAPVWANDEIGELGNAFNEMIESLAHSQEELEASNARLQQRNQELAVLYELAGMASQSFDDRRILAHGLEKALLITGAEAGSIALLDPEGDDLVLACQRNVPRDLLLVPDFNGQGGELIRRVLAGGEPLAIDRFDALADGSTGYGFRTFVCVPIKTKGNVLGALNIFCRQQAGVSAEGVTHLAAICNQLGVSIENARLWSELKRKEETRARLLAKVVSVQEEERRRISRELHDETGQALTSLLVQMKVMEKTGDVVSMREQVRGLRDVTAQTLEEVRRLSLDLRPSTLDDLGLVAALEWYVNDFAAKNEVTMHFDAPDSKDLHVPKEKEVVLYRIVQEALTNVARHARASEVWVEMQQAAGVVSVQVRDDGRGFDVPRTLGSHGLGLLGMQERVELIGGHFHLSSIPEQGTLVRAEVNLVEPVLSA